MYMYIGHREAWLNDVRLVESEYSLTNMMNVSSWGPAEVVALMESWSFLLASNTTSDVYMSE